MNPLCIESYLIFVNCLLLFFLWVVFTCVLICLVLLIDGFPSLILCTEFFFFLSKGRFFGMVGMWFFNFFWQFQKMIN
jgi:hypothetical protein